MPVSFAAPGTDGTLVDVDLEIVSAKGITAGDYLGLGAALKGSLSSSDAYVTIEIDGNLVAWTRPIFDSLEPEWNEKFFFKNLNPIHTIYDTETTFELPIIMQESKAGTINITVNQCHKVEADEFAEVQEVGPVRYSVHSSFTAGLLTMLTSNDARLESLAYRVQLHNIPQFLPTDNEWNKNYPTIQRIFSPDYPESPVLRQAVMTQHAVIYQHGQERTKYGSVASPADFFELVHNGRRNDKPVLFTYAITSKGWYFSETGAAFFKDMLSKHMLHSGAAFSVKYAGEFHIQQADDDTFKLVIDNNSGTYAPPQEQLPQLQELMENNFPGIICEALDRDDETLMEARKEIFAAWE
ncbi:C2 domain [Phytophthora infestans]|uniref:C2 domain n=2 Tax=Phytophthora infestans TaxID=4787 RepID=A0A8S9U2B1_PHYIN|nr:C2 domain [Phytophthora infestans]